MRFGLNWHMSGPWIIQRLTQKRAEILGRVKAYEAQIAYATHDLAHLNATLELFASAERQRVRYMASHGFFKKGARDGDGAVGDGKCFARETFLTVEWGSGEMMGPAVTIRRDLQLPISFRCCCFCNTSAFDKVGETGLGRPVCNRLPMSTRL